MKKASEILKEMKWIQNRSFEYKKDKEVACCMHGAIILSLRTAKTAKEKTEVSNKKRALIEHINKKVWRYTFICESISEWNDEEGRTKEEVIVMLEKFGL